MPDYAYVKLVPPVCTLRVKYITLEKTEEWGLKTPTHWRQE